MTRHHRPPVTEAEIWHDGGHVTVKDICLITNRSRQWVIAQVESGELKSIRYNDRGKYCFKREVVRAWLLKAGHPRHAA